MEIVKILVELVCGTFATQVRTKDSLVPQSW